MAQDLKQPTLDDLIPGGETYRRIENKWYQWYGDFACLELGIDQVNGTRVDQKTKKEFPVITLDEANKLLAEKELGKIHSFYRALFLNDLATLKGAKALKEDKYPTLMLVNTSKNRVLIDWKQKTIVWNQPCPEKAENQDWNEISRHLAYTVDNNLYVCTASGDIQQITNEPDGIVCGQSVHRNEFGITKGTFWSPKGDLLAFYRMDESMVAQYPLVDITARIGKVDYIRYPMAGMTSHKVTVGIYNPATQKTVYLKAGDPTDRYFTNISWAPDEKNLYLVELNRDQNHAKLCRYDVATGDLQATLLEETSSKYVEPQHPIVFLPWDSSKFIYQSQKDGFNHLYLYDVNGKFIKQLTSGKWLVQDIVGFNRTEHEVIISSTEVSPLQSNIYGVDLRTGKRHLIGEKNATHSGIQLSASGKYLIDRYASPKDPRTIAVCSTAGRADKDFTLFQAKDPYEGFLMPTFEVGTIKAADGTTDLYYRLTKPANFDPNKKYPVIIYVYGGPHAQMINNGWQNGARGWDIYMANKGYILFTLDNRGSENRGLEFENVTFRHLGIEECKDQVKGVDFLKSLPYIDANRIGVHGWSFGGHMTVALMLRHPEIFKVGVAGGPVIDWKYYEVMYGERYMDTPQTNPEGYKECDLKNLAGNLKGHLLIIHDDHDDTCVPQHSLSFLKACIDARTYPDFFTYPTHKHNVLGRDRVHLHEKITRYFEDYLK
ncbi:MAG: S9 family peptidase [Bacteroides sp.]|nr:S9 family peptidase [Bacteroides sp.]